MSKKNVRKPTAGEVKIRKLLAGNIVKFRKNNGLTQERAAEQCNLNEKHFQKLEKGKINVSVRTLDKLCRGFRKSAKELFA